MKLKKKGNNMPKNKKLLTSQQKGTFKKKKNVKTIINIYIFFKKRKSKIQHKLDLYIFLHLPLYGLCFIMIYIAYFLSMEYFFDFFSKKKRKILCNNLAL